MFDGLAPRQTPSSTNTPSDSPADQILKLISNPFQSSFQEDAFWTSLSTSLGFTALLALLFSLLRPRHNLVYAPKIKHADQKHAPPPVGRGFASWVYPVMKAKEDMLHEKLGTDAVVFLRFSRMLRNIFTVLGFVGLCIMIPVNVTQSNKALSQGLSAFAVMTPLYIWGGGLWAQVVVAWFNNIVVAYFLWHNYRRVHQIRRNYFESPEYQQSLHARSLIVRDLPKDCRSDEGIMRVTDPVNPTGKLPRTTVGRDVKILPDLIEEHEETVKKLESILARYLKNPDRIPAQRPTIRAPSKYKGLRTNGKVDAIDYLTERIRQLEDEIGHIREQVDKRNAMSYGFASWEGIAQAHTVAYAARNKNPKGVQMTLAPRPNDLIWNNVALSKSSRRNKRIRNLLWVTVLTIVWTPINAGIAIFLSNLANLGSVWPGFQSQLERHKGFWTVVQGIASPAITSIVYLILPVIFRRLQIRAGDWTKTARERHVLRNLYGFFILNNLIVFSLFSAVWQYITAVIQNDKSDKNLWNAMKQGQFFLTVTSSLCQISPFWVTWLLQRNLGAAIDLAQLWTLFYIWFARTFMSPTPRQNIEWTAPPPIDYASYYNYFLFYATVALCFSTLQPLVLIVAALYFSIDSFLKKYLLMYVFITKTESGGQFWRTLFNRFVFAVILSDVVIAIVVKARGTWTMVAAIAPLVFLMLGFKYYCSITYDLDMKYYSHTSSGMQDTERLATPSSAIDAKRSSQLSSKFGHPALSKPLMTPMVHARAREALAQIYRGRLDSNSNNANPFSDNNIPLTSLSKPNSDPPQAPFEIVPEAQQDFAYYKNRTDFRDEIGGSEVLYSQPEDAVTLRSQTPLSILGKNIGDYKTDYKSPPAAYSNTFDGTNHSTPGTSRSNSPAPSSSPYTRAERIQRKPIDQFHQGSRPQTPTNFSAPYRSQPHSRDGSASNLNRSPYTRVPDIEAADLSMRHDGYDDMTGLLGGAGDGRARFEHEQQRQREADRRSQGYDFFRGHR